jgi:hypothetical protein
MEAGIQPLVKSETGIAEHPFTVGPMADFQIFVAADDAERARTILHAVTSEDIAHDDTEGDHESRVKLLSSLRRQPSARDRRLLIVLGFVPVTGGLALLNLDECRGGRPWHRLDHPRFDPLGGIARCGKVISARLSAHRDGVEWSRINAPPTNKSPETTWRGRATNSLPMRTGWR